MKAILTIGIPGSGKTTWAEAQKDLININRDDIRAELFPNQFYKATRKREKEVTAVRDREIEAAAAMGLDIVISDTNINERTRTALDNQLIKLGFEVQYKWFPIDFLTAQKRNENREKTVPRQVVYSMYKSYNKQFGQVNPEVPFNYKLQDAYIFDVDGTLADMGSRNPFAWDKVREDKPKEHVVRMLLNLKRLGYKIVIVTGRDGICAEDTKTWLEENDIPWDRFYIRPQGNEEKDSVIKFRIYEEHLKHRYNILGVFDDRLQVAQMWHELGLPLFKVGDPIEEF